MRPKLGLPAPPPQPPAPPVPPTHQRPEPQTANGRRHLGPSGGRGGAGRRRGKGQAREADARARPHASRRGGASVSAGRGRMQSAPTCCGRRRGPRLRACEAGRVGPGGGGSWTLSLPRQPWTRLAPLRPAPVVVCVVFQIRKVDVAEREFSWPESSQRPGRECLGVGRAGGRGRPPPRLSGERSVSPRPRN